MNRGTIRQETSIEISNEQKLEEFATKEDIILKYAIEYRLSSGYRPDLSKDWKHSVRKIVAALVVQRKKASILYLPTAMDEDRWKQRRCDSVFQVIWMASPIVLEHQCLLGLREKVVKLVLLANLAGLGLFSFSLLVVIFYIMCNYHWS